MKVAIIRAPWWVRYCPPYILAFFAALLRMKGHSVEVHDLNNKLYHLSDSENKIYWDDRDYYSLWENPSFIEKLVGDGIVKDALNKILASKPEVICFTTHTPNALLSMKLAEKIKQSVPDTTIVFMGHKASRAQMAFDFAEKQYIDYVCTGEADLALVELLDKLATVETGVPVEVKGFLYKLNGAVIDAGSPEIVKELDKLPLPDYSDFKEDILQKRYSQPGRLDILDSRGCVNACHFCYERLFWQKYRTMSGQKIFEQIKHHREEYPGIDYFYFNGLLLNGDLDALEKFCDLVISDGLEIKWAGQAMIRGDMNKLILDKMKKAGCEWLYYGIESGSKDVLKSMNKRHKPDEALEVLKNTYESGISAQINVMFGFPTETEEDFNATLEFVKKAKPYINNILASQSFCTLEKETYMKKFQKEFNITEGSHHLYWTSLNGKLDYPERFRRYEEFCMTALAIGIPETSGVTRKKHDKWKLLGDYHYHKKDFDNALLNYKKSLDEEERDKTILLKLGDAYLETGDKRMAMKCFNEALEFQSGQFDKDLDQEITGRIADIGEIVE